MKQILLAISALIVFLAASAPIEVQSSGDFSRYPYPNPFVGDSCEPAQFCDVQCGTTTVGPGRFEASFICSKNRSGEYVWQRGTVCPLKRNDNGVLEDAYLCEADTGICTEVDGTGGQLRPTHDLFGANSRFLNRTCTEEWREEIPEEPPADGGPDPVQVGGGGGGGVGGGGGGGGIGIQGTGDPIRDIYDGPSEPFQSLISAWINALRGIYY